MIQPSGTGTFTSNSATAKLVMELDIVCFHPGGRWRWGNRANGHCLEKLFKTAQGKKKNNKNL